MKIIIPSKRYKKITAQDDWSMVIGENGDIYYAHNFSVSPQPTWHRIANTWWRRLWIMLLGQFAPSRLTTVETSDINFFDTT